MMKTKEIKPRPTPYGCGVPDYPSQPMIPNIKEYSTVRQTLFSHTILPYAESNFKLIDAIKNIPESVNVEDLVIVAPQYMERYNYSTNTKSILVCKETSTKNPDYNKQMAKYKKDKEKYDEAMFIYNEKLELYQKALTEWDKENRKITLATEKEKLEKKLAAIKQKIDKAENKEKVKVKAKSIKR